MIDWSAAAFLLSVLGGVPAEPNPADPMQFAQVSIREQILIRVPARMRPSPGAVIRPLEWKESRGPKCIPLRALAGAALLSQKSVDFVLKDRTRVRAELERSCPALDYYRGFYLNPTADGQICADRDSVRSRMGGQCEIERFRKLTPKPVK